MKRVGILTFQNSNNYGALLQAYAMQETLKALDYEPQVINYISSTMKSAQNLDTIFEQFRRDNIRLSERVDRAHLENLSYDKWLIGSDQVWNPNITGYDDAFFLPWINNEKRVAYAASFGMRNDEISQNMQYFHANLNHFSNISIREKSNLTVLKDILGDTIGLHSHIDPTLLLDSTAYDELICRENIADYDEPYILFFSYLADPRFIDWVNIASLYTGMPIYAITEIPYNKFVKGTKKIVTASVGRWLSLIKGAKLVVTDSYHGLMLSMIYKKPFYVYTSNNPGSTRIMDVLKEYNLEGFRISEIFNPAHIVYDVNYEIFDTVIVKQQEDSLNYLKQSI